MEVANSFDEEIKSLK